MQLPAPDTGLSGFPVSDSATVSMPAPDSGAITFPPAPIPIIIITAVTVVDVETSVETLTVPWYVVETVVDVATGVEVLASVTVEAETAVDVETSVVQIFDSVTAETVVDVETSVAAIVSTAVAAETTVDVTTEALVGTPRAIVTANTTVDVEVEVISIPVTSFTANTTVDVTTSATAVPVGVVTAETIVDVQTSGLITAFTPSGATITAETQTGSTTPAKTTGWVADTATYPGSVIVSNGVQMRGSKTGAKFKFSGPLYWSWSGNVNIAAYVGGVQRGTTAVVSIPNAYTEYQRSGEITIDVANGEVVDLYMWGWSIVRRHTSSRIQILGRVTRTTKPPTLRDLRRVGGLLSYQQRPDEARSKARIVRSRSAFESAAQSSLSTIQS